MNQRSTVPCDCGRKALVTPTESPFEFDWRCACSRRGTVSWAHANPPPEFQQAEPLAHQGSLFSDVGMGE